MEEPDQSPYLVLTDCVPDLIVKYWAIVSTGVLLKRNASPILPYIEELEKSYNIDTSPYLSMDIEGLK